MRCSPLTTIVTAALCLLLSAVVLAAPPTGHFLVRYSAGVNWNHQLGYTDQPGLRTHHEYLSTLYAADQLVMSGPLSEAAGSMVLLRIGSREEAEKIVELDPGVQTRILKAELIPWRIDQSSMIFVPRRTQPLPEDLQGTFRLRRIDPGSRLNQERQGGEP